MFPFVLQPAARERKRERVRERERDRQTRGDKMRDWGREGCDGKTG